MKYVNRLRYKNGIPTLASSSGVVNNGYYNGTMFYETTNDEPTPDPPTPEHDYSQDYFTIESLEDGNRIFFGIPNMYFDNRTRLVSLDYSYDNVTWSSVNLPAGNTSIGSTTTYIDLDKNEKILVRGNAKTYNISDSGTSGQEIGVRIGASKNYKIYGNINSLFNNSNTLPQSDYFSGMGYYSHLSYLFNGSTKLVDAYNLIIPFTNLNAKVWNQGIQEMNSYPGSCSNMFRGCTNLVYGPKELPNVGPYVYKNMFYNCYKLDKSPILSATHIPANCYDQLFWNCSSLNEITCLATSSDSNGTLHWVGNVSATGTFIKNASASWSTGTSGAPSGWTIQNYSS